MQKSFKLIAIVVTLLTVAIVVGACSPAANAPTATPMHHATSDASMSTTVPAPASTTAATATHSAPTSAPTTAPTSLPATPRPVQSPTVAAQPTTVPRATTAPASAAQVDIKGFLFKPNMLEVKVGTKVTWTNMDDIQHSVTSGTPPTPSGKFDSDFFTLGQTYSFTFTEPGDYAYFCKRHNSMTGMVHVTAP